MEYSSSLVVVLASKAFPASASLGRAFPERRLLMEIPPSSKAACPGIMSRGERRAAASTDCGAGECLLSTAARSCCLFMLWILSNDPLLLISAE